MNRREPKRNQKQQIYKDSRSFKPWVRVCYCSGNVPFVGVYETWDEAIKSVYEHARVRHGWGAQEVCS